MRKAAFYTLGCKVNQYETQAMMDLFSKNGFELCDFHQTADVYVINSCTVTGTGDKKSRQAVHRAKRQNPDSVVVLAGCYAQSLSEGEAKKLGADILLGTGKKNNVLEIVQKVLQEKKPIMLVDELSEHRIFEETPISSYQDKTRALLKIQDGCDRYCSYCIIPYVRGPVRSRQMEEIVKECTRLSQAGFQEVVLTGIQVAAYGSDLGKGSLIEVIEQVSAVKGIKRIRLSSLECVAITEDFLKRAKATGKLCPSFHLSLQSGSDSVLERMNRRYRTERYEKVVSLIRQFYPDAGITTDVIVGFPGETEEEFQQSLQFVEKIRFSQVHVFPYSPRKGTKAAQMDQQLEKWIKEERAKKMSRLGERLHQEFIRSLWGKRYPVLFEQKNKEGAWEGFTPNYVNVFVKEEDLGGKILEVTLSEENTTASR